MSDTGAASAEEKEATTSIRVALPLPLDVAASLMRVLGELYPSATVENGQTELVFHIPDAERFREDTALDEDRSQGAAPAIRTTGDAEAVLQRIDNGTFHLSVPEYLGKLLGGLATRALDGADAPNYLAIRMVGGEGANGFDVIVCRPGRPSPHELRARAEERCARLADALRSAGVDPDSID